MKFILIRSQHLEQEVLGNLLILSADNKIIFSCKSLELAWRNNQSNISCVPIGTYTIVLEYSPKYGMCWELKGVPGRSEVKIHNANYYRQLRGCIAVGDMHTHIDDDLVPDVRNSKYTRRRMEAVMSKHGFTQTTITIIDVSNK